MDGAVSLTCTRYSTLLHEIYDAAFRLVGCGCSDCIFHDDRIGTSFLVIQSWNIIS